MHSLDRSIRKMAISNSSVSLEIILPPKQIAFKENEVIDIVMTLNEALSIDATATATISIAHMLFTLDVTRSNPGQGKLLFTYTTTNNDALAVDDFEITDSSKDIIITGITDLAGNVINLSASNQPHEFGIQIITLPITAPILTLASDTGSSESDNITSNGTINIELLPTVQSCSYSVDGGFTWIELLDITHTSFTLDTGVYNEGDIIVRATDLAGHVTESSITSMLIVDQSINSPKLSPNTDSLITNNSDLVLTFDEAVTAVSGKKIVIRNESDNSLVEIIDASSTVVSNDGKHVTINPDDSKMIVGQSYFIEADDGSFTDVAGNSSLAINNWQFSIVPMAANITVGLDNFVNAAELADGYFGVVEVSMALSISEPNQASTLAELTFANFTVLAVDSYGQAIRVDTRGYDSATGIWTGQITQSLLHTDGIYTLYAVVTDYKNPLNTILSNFTGLFLVDRFVPELSFSGPIADDNIINASEAASGFSISGKSSLIAKEIVITLNDKTYMVSDSETKVIDGEQFWSVLIPSADIALLSNDNRYDVKVNAIDFAGNKAIEIVQSITLESFADDHFFFTDENLETIDGGIGYDIVTFYDDSTMDASLVNVFNIEFIDMANTFANSLIISAEQVDKNGSILNVLMDNKDTVKYTSTSFDEVGNPKQVIDVYNNASTTQDMIVFGTSDDDSIDMSAFNEIVYGRGGNDVFIYSSVSDMQSASKDVIIDFSFGASGDIINLSDLLTHMDGDDLTQFMTVTGGADEGGDVTIKIDKDGSNDFSTPDQTIILNGIGSSTTEVNFDSLNEHNFVL